MKDDHSPRPTRRTSRTLRVPWVAFAAVATVAACSTPLGSIAKRLDIVERYLEEWGSVAVSGAIYVPDQQRFALDYERSLEEHITAAQNQLHAGVARLNERSAEVRSRTDVRPVTSGSGDGSAEPPEVTVTDDFATDRFLPQQALLGDQEFTIPLTDAIRAGYSSKFQEQLLSFLANPGKLSHDAKLHMIVTQVSCTPGWRTRTDYMADVRVTVDNAARRGRQEGPRVRVAAVFPLVESQNLDLKVSLRDQLALLNSLSTTLQQSGLVGESSTISQYARRLQQDSASKSVLPVISSYVSESSFGYQFRPVFRAIDDLTDPQSQGEYVLNPVSFPVLALLVTEKDDENQEVERISLSADVKWYRTERPGLWSNLVEKVSLPLYFAADAESGTPARSKVRDRICRLEHLDAAFDELSSLPASVTTTSAGADSAAANDLWNKLVALYEAYNTGPQILRVHSKSAPAKPATAPKIADVLPAGGPSNEPLRLIVIGSGFSSGTKGIVKCVNVSGRNCDFEVLSDKVVCVSAPPLGNRDPGASVKQHVVVATAAGADSFAIQLDQARRLEDPRIEIERDPDGRIERIFVVPGNRDNFESLLDRARHVLEIENAGKDGKIEFRVDASGSMRASAESAAVEPDEEK